MSKIAIIGSNGFLGAPTLKALESATFASKIAYPVLAVTRNAKDKTDSDKVKWVEGTLDEAGVEPLTAKLEGVDVIVELTGANPELFLVVEKIVGIVKPKLFIPSQFGTELHDASKVLPNFLSLKTTHSENTRSAGIKTVDIITSFFADKKSFLYEIVGHAGIDPESKTVTYFGNPDQKAIGYTTLTDIGRVVASVATSDPASLPNTIRVVSGEVSFREVKEKYEQNHKVELTEKEVDADEALKQAQAKYASGFDFKDFLYYLQVLASQGKDKGITFSTDERELVNPGESLWKWEKY